MRNAAALLGASIVLASAMTTQAVRSATAPMPSITGQDEPRPADPFAPLRATERARVDAEAEERARKRDLAWPSEAVPPPVGLLRDVPEPGRVAVVARGTPGSWREPGDTCSMAAGGGVEVIGWDETFGALVRHARPRGPDQDPGRSCTDGAIVFVPTDVLFHWPGDGAYERRRRAMGSAVKGAADRLLGPAP